MVTGRCVVMSFGLRCERRENHGLWPLEVTVRFWDWLQTRYDVPDALFVDIRDLLPRDPARDLVRGNSKRFRNLRDDIMSKPRAKDLLIAICEDLVRHRFVGVACAGGNHRSRTLVEVSAEEMRRRGWDVIVIHLGSSLPCRPDLLIGDPEVCKVELALLDGELEFYVELIRKNFVDQYRLDPLWWSSQADVYSLSELVRRYGNHVSAGSCLKFFRNVRNTIPWQDIVVSSHVSRFSMHHVPDARTAEHELYESKRRNNELFLVGSRYRSLKGERIIPPWRHVCKYFWRGSNCFRDRACRWAHVDRAPPSCTVSKSMVNQIGTQCNPSFSSSLSSSARQIHASPSDGFDVSRRVGFGEACKLDKEVVSVGGCRL